MTTTVSMLDLAGRLGALEDLVYATITEVAKSRDDKDEFISEVGKNAELLNHARHKSESEEVTSPSLVALASGIEKIRQSL